MQLQRVSGRTEAGRPGDELMTEIIKQTQWIVSHRVDP